MRLTGFYECQDKDKLKAERRPSFFRHEAADPVEIDNNLAENSIRALAVGRKNYLFAGSHQAAEMIAAMYSFMASCKRNGVNETEWLTDVLERIQSHKQKDLYQLSK